MIYRVGNIDVDTINFHLSENGSSIAVEPQVFDLIIYMITHRDRLVTRDELFDKLWTGKIVSDTSLSNHIKSARKALGDDGHKQQVIKTIHGRGYQFIATTEEVIDNTKIPGKAEIDKDNDSDNSIAVLAFSDLSPEQDQEYFSDGISEELLNLLTKIPSLKVISRTSSFSFKGKNETIENIGSALNVAHILDGSIRKAGDQLRISVQLIKVDDGTYLWSKTFDREMKNIFEIQDDIAQTVIQQLRITLHVGLAKTSIVNPDAYTLFLEAKYFSFKHTGESFTKAEKTINESLAIDPDYAPSWELLGRIIFNATMYFYLKPYKLGLKESNNAALKSIELDPGYAPGYALMALVNISNWKFDKAAVNINKALLLDSGNVTILNSASVVAMNSGKILDAITFENQTIKYDPLKYTYYINLGTYYLMLNLLDKAAKAIEIYEFHNPDSEIQHTIMSSILLEQGKFSEALTEAEKEPNDILRSFTRNSVLFSMGKIKQANQLLAQLIDSYHSIYPAAIAYLFALRKDNNKAFKWLEMALQQQDPALTETINYIGFRNLWGDPRWCDFIIKMKIPKDHWLFESLVTE